MLCLGSHMGLSFGLRSVFQGSLMQQEWEWPSWWYQNKRPPNDDAYFENLSRIVFLAGLNWHVIEKKWVTIKPAFANFSIEKVACFNDADLERLLQNPGVIRSRGKIQAIILNAREMQKIQKEYGSFQKYLDSQDKSNNYQNVVQDLTRRFKWLGPNSASMFLHSVGEKIKHEDWE